MFSFVILFPGNAKIIFKKQLKQIQTAYEYHINNGYEYEEDDLIMILTHTLGEDDEPQTACHVERDGNGKHVLVKQHFVKFYKQDWVEHNAVDANKVIITLGYCRSSISPIINVQLLNIFKIQWYNSKSDYYLLYQ